MIEDESLPPRDFGAFRELLFGHFESLSPHLRRIAEYALGEPSRFALQTVAEVAGETGVQPSTLVRFAKVFGFSGHSELQQLFRARLLRAENSYRDRVREHEERIAVAATRQATDTLQAFADASVLAIQEFGASIEAQSLREAIRFLNAARCIHVYGRGRAWPVAACLAYGLTDIGRPCNVLDGLAGPVARQIAAMRAGDILMAVALADDSPSLAEALESARVLRIPVLSITDSVLNAPARRSNVNLVIRDFVVSPSPPLAAHIVLAQSLVFALAHDQSVERSDSHPVDNTLID